MATPVLAPATLNVEFPAGLVGCEGWKQFRLTPADEPTGHFAVLECLDEPGVAFVLGDPTDFLPDYRVSLGELGRQLLGLAAGATPLVYCTLSVGDDGWITANLAGPIVVNPSTGTARQLVLADAEYSTRHQVARLVHVQAARPGDVAHTPTGAAFPMIASGNAIGSEGAGCSS
jgi:flagellar assembly factor FliW